MEMAKTKVERRSGSAARVPKTTTIPGHVMRTVVTAAVLPLDRRRTTTRRVHRCTAMMGWTNSAKATGISCGRRLTSSSSCRGGCSMKAAVAFVKATTATLTITALAPAMRLAMRAKAGPAAHAVHLHAQTPMGSATTSGRVRRALGPNRQATAMALSRSSAAAKSVEGGSAAAGRVAALGAVVTAAAAHAAATSSCARCAQRTWWRRFRRAHGRCLAGGWKIG
mmetsp:Transcript_24482/g.72569  ORF Transcript_24482/g.72569 Transcript_24482/m.72569 type:complete len:224 (+) Transcript_24482:225-896(+)